MEAHVYDDDADATCNVCGYERTITPTVHEHSYGAWSHDETSHWHACTDADCPDRPGSIKDTAAHVYDDDTDADCNVCGYEHTVTPPAAERQVVVEGSYAPLSGAGRYAVGSPVVLYAGSRENYLFTGWTSDDVVIANPGSAAASFLMPDRDVTVRANWLYTGSGSTGPVHYLITASALTGGSVSPDGSVSVRAGSSQSFTITPDLGYVIADVKVDGQSIGAVSSYTFEKLSGSHTIEARFAKQSAFADVPMGSYYEEAVRWAVENGVTSGTDAAHFSPDGTCTRAQAVAFLWRAAGSPAPKNRTMPFTDVKAGGYYYDAVLWAVENSITTGTSATAFSPDAACTRAQIITFLYRMVQSEGGGFTGAWMFLLPFSDTPEWAYEAIAWCYQKGITAGTSETTFSPNAPCTRAQIVTFLWRSKK